MDRPILFSGPMVRAILDGRKTQTRRVLKHDRFFENGWPVIQDGRKVGVKFGIPTLEQTAYRLCDRLWVRESFATDGPVVRFPATDAIHELRKKTPSIHMPRWASRLTLTVTDVRVQRLQDITPEDARAEGAPAPDAAYTIRDSFMMLWDSINAKRAGGAFSWGTNPWVVAITFKAQHGNIDKLGVAP